MFFQKLQTLPSLLIDNIIRDQIITGNLITEYKTQQTVLLNGVKNLNAQDFRH